jgi:hypothetical protein
LDLRISFLKDPTKTVLIGPGTRAQGKQLFETKSRLSRIAPMSPGNEYLRPPKLEITGVIDKYYIIILNGTKWEIFIVRRQ